MFDFLDGFDLEDFVIATNLIEEFEQDQIDELGDLNDPGFLENEDDFF